MAWTEQDYQEIVARLKKDSQGVGDVPEAESLDGITSLPAYQDAEGEDMPKIVRAPLSLLAEPALEAAEKANEAAEKANKKASAAETATQSANEAATNTNQAIQNAKTATDAANASASSANQATENANTAASNANSKATLADTAAANANDTAEHPTYIGEDHYVYKWNKTAKAYDKTDIYTKGDAFSIKKVYASVAELEADKSNPDIAEGDFVLVNTGDVEDPDNAKLYVKVDGNYEFLVDMSGAIGFTGKTPQFSMGTVTTLEAGASATATVSSDGTDEGGNPKYKLNFAIPRGNPGAPFKPVGQYDTLELLKQAIPDGSDVDGMIAVGTEAPYDYYAWLNGEWVSQGKVTGGNVIILPKEILDLTGSSSSEEIFAAFGGIDKFKDLLEKLSTNNYLVQIGEPELGSLRYIYTLVDYAVKLASNKQSGTISLNIYNESRQLRRFHFYLENNGTTARCGEASTFQLVRDTDVLTKTNTSSFTPTGDYQPATKKYVDITTTKFVQLGTSNLNDFVGSDSEGFIGVQTYGANATLDRNYPIAESGMLICAGSINQRTNQIYQTFNSNRTFTRGAGINDFTPWKELASINDVLTKDNTTEYTPTSDYNPAPKAYVDNSISNSRSVGYMMQLTEIDASGLDENTWYPVVMSLGNRNTVRIEVIAALDIGVKPSWATHDSGFSVRKIWEVNGGGWGTSEVNRQIFVSDYRYADTDPVRGVNQLTNLSNEYVFVRGGGKYFFYTSHGVVPTLYTGTLTIEGGQSISPTTETPAEIVANMATKEYVDGSISNGFYYINNNQFIDYFITPSYYKDSEAETAITQCFNTIDNFKAFVDKAIDAGVALVFLNNSLNEKCYIRDYHVYKNNNNYELSFIFNYSSNGDGGVEVISTRVFISWNASYGYKFIVRNLVSSDNLTTITKKTSGEYEALTKDDKTMYAVTD